MLKFYVRLSWTVVHDDGTTVVSAPSRVDFSLPMMLNPFNRLSKFIEPNLLEMDCMDLGI